MTVFSPIRRRFPSCPGAAAGALSLALAGCTVGIDDRPVPPEAIPLASAETSPATTLGAAGDNYSGLAAAAGPIASAPLAAPAASGSEMVWQTGAQPARIESAELAPPAEDTAEASVAEAPAEESGTAAEAQPEQVEPEVEKAAVVNTAFRLAPVVGADARAAAPLTRALRAEAAGNGVALDGDSGAPVLKTYLSSFPDGGDTVLVYVFDIYDSSGTRLTRIDGQEKAPGSLSGWGEASPDTVKAVAADAMRRLAAWQGRRSA